MTRKYGASAAARIGVVVLAVMSSAIFYILILRAYGALPTVRQNQALIMAQSDKIDSLLVYTGITRERVDSLVVTLRPWRIPCTAIPPDKLIMRSEQK